MQQSEIQYTMLHAYTYISSSREVDMAGYIPQTYFFVVEASAILMHHVN